jgi:phosphatidylinositol 4-kinase
MSLSPPQGILKKYDKDERKARIADELVKFGPTRSDLYIPTNPDCRVISHINTSGTPMQSAAKVRAGRERLGSGMGLSL